MMGTYNYCCRKNTTKVVIACYNPTTSRAGVSHDHLLSSAGRLLNRRPAGLDLTVNVAAKNRKLSARLVDTILFGMVLISVLGLAYAFISH